MDDFDVLVVGGGAAGLYAALCLPETLRIGLITKDSLSKSASDWAQGGIAAAIAPGDSPDFHYDDTLRAGAGLCEPEAVKFLVEQAPDCIQSLLRMGVAFDRRGKQLAMTLEAAHSHPRVLHAADTTGRELINTLTAQVFRRPNIQILAHAFALNLWIENGCCQGISLIYNNQVIWRKARAVILATGGGGQVFAQTTNPAVSTGDGVAIAHRSGALLRDLEFVQFHPTALTVPHAPRFLISEAVRGEGAHLVDQAGSRFAFDYHPKGELAPRDIVSRAIFSHLQKTAADPAQACVYLDLRPIPNETIRHRFPNIIQVCQQWGIDLFNEPIPVAPAAHYWMGGIATDTKNQTSIPGLYAVGETASTGVHGANRLASNSLLECIVFGSQFSKIELLPAFKTSTSLHNSCSLPELKPNSLRQDLQRLVWQSAGICRTEEILESALTQIKIWQDDFSSLPLSQLLLNLSPLQAVDFDRADSYQTLQTWAETYNLLDIAYLILKSAVFRTESRGGHYRLDYPQSSLKWQIHTLVKQDRWKSETLFSLIKIYYVLKKY